MEKLLEAVLKMLESSNPTKPLTTERKNRIEQRLFQMFPDFHTPTHPPYASMIFNAITKLNGKKGSSEKSISTYIKRNYADLPWAHATYLSHYLEKLKLKGEIYVTHNNCYKLTLNPNGKGKKRKREHSEEAMVVDQSRPREQLSIVGAKRKQPIRLRFVSNKKGEDEDPGKRKWLRIERIEESGQSYNRRNEITKAENRKSGQVEVLEELNQKKEKHIDLKLNEERKVNEEQAENLQIVEFEDQLNNRKIQDNYLGKGDLVDSVVQFDEQLNKVNETGVNDDPIMAAKKHKHIKKRNRPHDHRMVVLALPSLTVNKNMPPAKSRKIRMHNNRAKCGTVFVPKSRDMTIEETPINLLLDSLFDVPIAFDENHCWGQTQGQRQMQSWVKRSMKMS